MKKKNTHGYTNSFLGGLAFALLCAVLLFRPPVTQIALGILIGGVALYVSCLCYVVTIRREQSEEVNRLRYRLDEYDDTIDDLGEELTYEKTRDSLFDSVIDTIRLSADPKAIAAMVAAYDLLRDEKDRYIRAHTSQRLQDLEAMQHPAAPDAAPCALPT